MPSNSEPVYNIMREAQEFSNSSSPLARNHYEIYSKLQGFLGRTAQRLAEIEARIANTAQVPGAVVVVPKFITLTADLNIAVPSEPNGTLILYVFLQGSAGGWVINWPAPFKGFIQPDPAPGFYSMMLAYKRSANLILPAAAFVPGIDPA